jgi:tetratricopeptide (TPR) repeat protein
MEHYGMRSFRMKQRILMIIVTILLTACSSIPKEARVQAVNTQKDQAAVYLERGHREYTWDNYESALHQYMNAFTLSSSVDWQEGMVKSLVHLSRASDRMKESVRAKIYLDQAVDLMTEIESLELNTLVLNRKTEWFLFNDTPKSALQLNDDVLKNIDKLKGEEAGEVWRIRAVVLKAMKDYDQALIAIEKALERDQKGNYLSELASDYYIRASVLSLSGREEEAAISMTYALEKDKFIENTPGIAQDLYGLGLIYEKIGENEKANHYFQRSYLVQKGANRNDIPEKLLEKLQNLENGSPWIKDTDAF